MIISVIMFVPIVLTCCLFKDFVYAVKFLRGIVKSSSHCPNRFLLINVFSVTVSARSLRITILRYLKH